MPRQRRWTDKQLIVAVTNAETLAGVCRAIGIKPGSYDDLRRHIERLGIDVSHLTTPPVGGVRQARAFTDEQLADAVEASVSVAEVLRRLGYRPSGGTHRFIVAHIRDRGLNTDHFTGQGWARGKRLSGGFKRRPLDEILVADSTWKSASNLRKRLIREGLKEPRCEICGIDSWFGEHLPLMLDHINGDHRDNRLANLRILCPNCHALTDTWCGRNRKPA